MIMEKIAKLINVKTIVTLVVMVVFSVLVLRRDALPSEVMQVVTMVIAFYFGTQHEKRGERDEHHD